MHELTLPMRSSGRGRGVRVVCGLFLLWSLAPAGATADTVVGSSSAAAVVAIEGFSSAADGTVSGELVNNSGRLLRDVQVLIRYAWLWKNERSPGRDSPGRSDFYTVPGEISAGGRLRFSYTPLPPLQQRTDGTFDISAEIVGFTEVGD
jgi:hypothetical protein